ncbi:DHA2 family efflux MFS transporter permease subunit [Streptomyces sp. NPDC003038]|uniref:DHA2 family efflux MFS transporter permease subunit n=1 Tax=unclassified Streptomyces TaxID=2593676 RepID=UPI0033A66D34
MSASAQTPAPTPAQTGGSPSPSGSASTAPPYTRPGATLLTACGATFIAFLGVSVVYIAFPELPKSFPDASLPSLSWVVSGYTVVFAAALAPAGRLADVIGLRKLFNLSVAGFTLASLLCALAPTVEVLIAFCALQGLFAAGMIPSSLGLLLASRAPQQRAKAIGLWGASSSAAAAVGTPLGGFLVHSFGWPAVFLVNVPLGAALLALAWWVLPRIRAQAAALPDLIGTVALMLGVGGLVAALTKGSAWGWDSPQFLAVLAGGALLLALALTRSRRHRVPALELSLLRTRKFAVANASFLLFGAAMYCWLLASPLFAAEIWHYSPLQAGLALTPGALVSVVVSVLAGRMPRRHQRAVVVTGALLFAVQCGIWAVGLRSEPDFLLVWLPANVIGGVGIGAVMTTLSATAAGSLPPHRFAAGAGMVMTSRQVGAAMGTGAFAALIAALSGPGVSAFRTVFAVCTVLAVLAGAIALWLTDPGTGPADEARPAAPSAPSKQTVRGGGR